MLTFIHISDTHIHSDPSYTREGAPTTSQAGARALVREINGLSFRPNFVLHTGDVAYDPYEAAHETAAQILAGIRYPVYYLAGNHDASAALQRHFIPDKTVMRQLHYNMDVNGVQIVAVDSNGPADPPRGYMTDTQLRFLQEICDADDPRPLIIATHHNPISVGVPWLDDYMGIQNGEAFHAAILPARHRLRGVFFGHVHQNIDIYRDGILYASTLSSWMQLRAYPGLRKTEVDSRAEPGYSIVTVTADRTFIRRCRFPIPTA
jgi:3',5'-cyclic-AMP phosphodiesterase